jgi:glycosidase
VFDGDPVFVSFYQGGRAQFDGVDSGLHTLFDFPLFFTLRRAFGEGKTVREVANMFARDRLYPRPGELVTFLGLHDVDRFMNVKGATAEGLKLAFTLLMTARGTPLIYYGDEIAMPGGGDPDNRRDFPGGWPGDAKNAFEPAGRTADQQAVWDHVAQLTRLRAATPALRRGVMRSLLADDSVYAYERVLEGQRAVVALNNGAQPREIEFELPDLAAGAEFRDALGGGGPEARVRDGRMRVLLGPRSGRVWVSR